MEYIQKKDWTRMYKKAFLTSLTNLFKVIFLLYFKSFGEYDLLYYNAAYTIFPLVILSYYSNEIEKVYE
jgi:hypothetical protein